MYKLKKKSNNKEIEYNYNNKKEVYNRIMYNIHNDKIEVENNNKTITFSEILRPACKVSVLAIFMDGSVSTVKVEAPVSNATLTDIFEIWDTCDNHASFDKGYEEYLDDIGRGKYIAPGWSEETMDNWLMKELEAM